MTGIFSTSKPFLQQSAWQSPHLNALRYQTSQPGMVIPIIYGTARQQFNLIDLANFFGPGGGKKGMKAGPLPITGTSNSVGKGGGKDGGKKGGKKSGDFSVDIDMAICQGPVSNTSSGFQNLVWSGQSIAFFSGLGLNFYSGSDGQAADPTFAGLGHNVGYSGTCHITATPMDLGNSPVIPNISFEITGFLVGTAVGPAFTREANPGHIVVDFLTNNRYGAGIDTALIDPNVNTVYSNYCQAIGLLVSVILDGHQKAADWVDGLMKLTNSTVVSADGGKLIKFIPFGDVALTGNDVNWTPNLIWQYSLTDDDFIPFDNSAFGGDPESRQSDPIQVTRSNPADAQNWISIEYTERANSYNTTVLAEFDQGLIDQYGIRTGETISGKAFCNQTSAQAAARLTLNRLAYIRNTYHFQLSWAFSLLEPMDIVLLTGSSGDSYLVGQPVRILSVEENDNGDLTFTAEEIQVGVHGPSPIPPPPPVPPGGPGLWDPQSTPGSTGGLPSATIVSADHQDVSLPANGIFIFGSVATENTHATGKWYFELTGESGSVSRGITLICVDLDARLMWNKTCLTDNYNTYSSGADVGSGGSYLLGLGTPAFVANNAARIPLPSGSRIGATATSLSVGFPFGYPYGYWFNATMYHALDGTTDWNDDPTANPATGVGGVSLLTLPSGDLHVCLSIECITGPTNPMRIHTNSNGTYFVAPSGFTPW